MLPSLGMNCLEGLAKHSEPLPATLAPGVHPPELLETAPALNRNPYTTRNPKKGAHAVLKGLNPKP